MKQWWAFGIICAPKDSRVKTIFCVLYWKVLLWIDKRTNKTFGSGVFWFYLYKTLCADFHDGSDFWSEYLNDIFIVHLCTLSIQVILLHISAYPLRIKYIHLIYVCSVLKQFEEFLPSSQHSINSLDQLRLTYACVKTTSIKMRISFRSNTVRIVKFLWLRDGNSAFSQLFADILYHSKSMILTLLLYMM